MQCFEDDKTMTMNIRDKWWTGDTFEEEWNATSEAGGRVQWLWGNIIPTRLKECLNTKEVA